MSFLNKFWPSQYAKRLPHRREEPLPQAEGVRAEAVSVLLLQICFLLIFVTSLAIVVVVASKRTSSKNSHSQEALLSQTKEIERKGEVCELCKDWVSFIEQLIDEGYVYSTIIEFMKV